MNKRFDWTNEAAEVEQLVKDGKGIYEACKTRGYSYTAFSKGVPAEKIKEIKDLKKTTTKAAASQRTKERRHQQAKEVAPAA